VPKRIGGRPDFLLDVRVSIEIRRGRQRARKQKRGVNRGKLALPCAAAGLHVEKMIIETLLPGRVGFRSVWTGREKRSVCRVRLTAAAREINPRDPNRVGRQRKPSSSNTGRPILRRLVSH